MVVYRKKTRLIRLLCYTLYIKLFISMDSSRLYTVYCLFFFTLSLYSCIFFVLCQSLDFFLVSSLKCCHDAFGALALTSGCGSCVSNYVTSNQGINTINLAINFGVLKTRSWDFGPIIDVLWANRRFLH